MVVGAVVTSPRAYAAEGDELCTWSAIAAASSDALKFCVFTKVVEAYPELDIVRTAQNFFISMVTEAPCHLLFEQNCDEAMVTALKSYNVASGNPTALRRLMNEENPYGLTTKLGRGGRGNAGLLGIVYKLGGALDQPDAMPLNLALYAQDQIKNIPLVGNRAYAAEYGLIGENLVLELWKLARNIAYAMLSVVMIVIGAMVMVRRKVNPQLVVSVESAIPKIVIAVILITFSYPIGATAAALLGPFTKLATDILNGLSATLEVTDWDFLTAISLSSLANLTWTSVAALLLMLPAGALTIVLYLLFGVVWLIILGIAYIKQFFIYVKILISIVTAPFTFALGAIPGNEDMVTNWFKLLAARIVGVTAMWTVFAMQAFILAYMMANGGKDNSIWETSGGELTQLLVAVLGPVISLMLLTASLSMPKKIEELFVGAPKKKG